jgi:hypothetical protein
MTGRLPDFIFGRRADIEREAGFVLAGQLVTDIPVGSKIRKADRRLIAQLIRQLVKLKRNDPWLHETGLWPRHSSKPPDGLSPPFDDELMRARCRRCIVIAIRVSAGEEAAA